MEQKGAGSHACIDWQLNAGYADHTYRARLHEVYIVADKCSVSEQGRLDERKGRVPDNKIFQPRAINENHERQDDQVRYESLLLSHNVVDFSEELEFIDR